VYTDAAVCALPTDDAHSADALEVFAGHRQRLSLGLVPLNVALERLVKTRFREHAYKRRSGVGR
jgi:hypothetical protein